MFFENELEAFDKYADAFANITLLIDTYSTARGIENAIAIGKAIRQHGKKLEAVRLDSGDLAKLSIDVRKRLDEEGFADTKIIASNSLDEHIISSIKKEGCAIDTWGVGTKLVTGDKTSAASCVYKLSAVQENNIWQPRMKISDHPSKTSLPGIQNVKRFYDKKKNLYCHDMIFNQLTTSIDEHRMFSFALNRMITIADGLDSFDLLVPIIEAGNFIYKTQSLPDIQKYVKNELARLPYSFKRFVNPDYYSVGLEKNFYNYKNQLLQDLSNRPMA